jgi:hypothetical protein
VRDKVDAVLVEERARDDPRRARDHLVRPAAVAHRLQSFLLAHDRLALVAVRVGVGADADDQRRVRVEALGLLERARVAKVEEVEDACCGLVVVCGVSERWFGGW